LQARNARGGVRDMCEPRVEGRAWDARPHTHVAGCQRQCHRAVCLPVAVGMRPEGRKGRPLRPVVAAEDGEDEQDDDEGKDRRRDEGVEAGVRHRRAPLPQGYHKRGFSLAVWTLRRRTRAAAPMSATAAGGASGG